MNTLTNNVKKIILSFLLFESIFYFSQNTTKHYSRLPKQINRIHNQLEKGLLKIELNSLACNLIRDF